MKYIHECEFCNESFESSKSNAKFCSTNCRVKNHNETKKNNELKAAQSNAIDEQEEQRKLHIRKQLHKKHGLANTLAQHWKHLENKLKHLEKQIDLLKYNCGLEEFEIEERNIQAQHFKKKWKFNTQECKRIKEWKANEETNIHNLGYSIRLSTKRERLTLENQMIEKHLEKIFNDNAKARMLLFDLKWELNQNKSIFSKKKKRLTKIKSLYRQTIAEINALVAELERPKQTRTITIPLNNSIRPKRATIKNVKQTLEIGAGDLQDVDFSTFKLPTELGRFLGDLDINRTCFALTGDSGAGKTYFSFELANLFITGLGIKAKYFSLEEGIGKLTQQKVIQYGLGNELSIVSKGDLEAVRIAAKSFPLIIVDSFNKLNAKAADFEALRTDFPKTLFILIFQKTTSGTMRGGSSIKYDSSATIDVIIRDGERIAIMEKGRYGTIGWEYSIEQRRVIKDYR